MRANPEPSENVTRLTEQLRRCARPLGDSDVPRSGGGFDGTAADGASQHVHDHSTTADAPKLNARADVGTSKNAEMVARLLASRGGRRELTDAEVLAQVRAARKSVATEAPVRVRPQWVRCECGGHRLASLRVHSPQNRDGRRVDCMGREVSP